MATLRILVPDGTTNYITNPSMRYDASGWNATAGVAQATFSDDFKRADGAVANGQYRSIHES